MSGSGPSQTSSGHTPPALLSSKLVDLRKENEVYIAEVVDASRNMLRHVINGLVPYDGLRHAPVRTHFRILSGAMFLLKVSHFPFLAVRLFSLPHLSFISVRINSFLNLHVVLYPTRFPRTCLSMRPE